MLEVDIAHKTVPSRDGPRMVLAGLRFGLQQNEIVALVGPSRLRQDDSPAHYRRLGHPV
jgi:predicted ABC-type transport system involved in lysophospholipase L1 biosynthesis ATPase subunit